MWFLMIFVSAFSVRRLGTKRNALAYSFLGLLFSAVLSVFFFLVVISFDFLVIIISRLPIATVCESSEQFACLCGHTVYPTRVDLDTSIESAAGLLKIDAIALLQ